VMISQFTASTCDVVIDGSRVLKLSHSLREEQQQLLCNSNLDDHANAVFGVLHFSDDLISRDCQ
jgi:hypothetical protein